MYFKLNLIIVFKVAITCALKIFDNQAKMLTVENNPAEYRYGLYKHNDILDVTCNGINNEESCLRWSIARHGVNRIDCETHSGRSIDYRVHLRAIDDGTMLTCQSFEHGKWIDTTLKLTLDKSNGTSQDKFCKSMSNVFCLDRVKSANIDVVVNNERLQGYSDQLSATYQYKYNSNTADVTITCAARNDPEKLMICGNIKNTYSNCTKDAECRVTSHISNRVRNSIYVIHCYAMKDGWVSGNIAQLIVYFVSSSANMRQESSNDLSVIRLSTTPRAVEHSSNYSNEYRKVLYIMTSLVVSLVVIVLLVLLLRSFKRKGARGHRNWNAASFEHTNSAMEYVTENNYYVGIEDIRTSAVGNDMEPCYREPLQPSSERTSSGPPPAVNSSPNNATYANVM